MAGRITSICDVFDALISERPYKPAWPIEKALEEIKSKSGSYFDPRLVVLFMKLETDQFFPKSVDRTIKICKKMDKKRSFKRYNK